MTAAVAAPRVGHLADLKAAVAASQQGPDETAYYTGFILGFTATFCDDKVLADLLAEARWHLWAATYSLEGALQRLALLGRNGQGMDRERYLRACGVLYGWKQGTAERDDAQECSVCEARILTETDPHGECRYHGYFCSEDCLSAMCERGCHRADDITARF